MTGSRRSRPRMRRAGCCRTTRLRALGLRAGIVLATRRRRYALRGAWQRPRARRRRAAHDGHRRPDRRARDARTCGGRRGCIAIARPAITGIGWRRCRTSASRSRRCAVGSPTSGRMPIDDAFAARRGAERVTFLPYLTGERTPWLNPAARGGWLGLGLGHTRGTHDAGRLRGRRFFAARGARCDPRERRAGERAAACGRWVGGCALASVAGRRVECGVVTPWIVRTRRGVAPRSSAALLPGTGMQAISRHSRPRDAGRNAER